MLAHLLSPPPKTCLGSCPRPLSWWCRGASTPKPSCRGLWVRPGRAPEAKKARLDQETRRVAGVGREPGHLASLPTVSVLVHLSSPAPALPSLCHSSALPSQP